MLSRLTLSNVLRHAAKLEPVSVANFHTNTKDIAETQRLIDNWKRCNAKYYSPERDTVNFPHPVRAETHPPVRLGFFPSSWFEALYSKTGVSGPYFALGGFLTYLFSKELWVMDHEFNEFVPFMAAFYFFGAKRFGPKIRTWLDSGVEKLDNRNFHEPMELSRAAFADAVGKIDGQIEQEARHKFIYDIQRENLELQLEARYRERMAEVHDAVKRRLDYQVELVNTRKRLEQDHMVRWIVDNVVKGITPKQEQDAITSCIANIKTLAKTNPAI